MKKLTLTLSAAFLFVCISSGEGVIQLSDNFDSYADQAAFQTAWPVVGTQPSGLLVSTQSFSGLGAVYINKGTATADSMRNGRSFAETGLADATTWINWSINFYDATGTGNPHRSYAALQDGASPTGSGQLIGLGLNNNLLATAEGGNYYMARILGYNSGAYFKLNDTAAPLRSQGWHNLAVTITPDSFMFYVDGTLSKTIANTYTLRSYDLVRLGAGYTSTAESWYDDVIVQTMVVPEPSVGVLGLLGGFALFIRRLVRRRC